MTKSNDTPDQLTKLLELLVNHAATSAKDATFKPEDLPELAHNLAKNYGYEILQWISDGIGPDQLTTGLKTAYRGDGVSHYDLAIENRVRQQIRNNLGLK